MGGKKGKKVSFEYNLTQLWLSRWDLHLFIVNFQKLFSKVSKNFYAHGIAKISLVTYNKVIHSFEEIIS